MTPLDRVLRLPIWTGRPEVKPLGGGITNVNFVVQDDARRCVVRIGDDIPVHQILRFNELSASRAAHAAGISPAVLHHEPGALVIDFIEGRTLAAADFHDAATLESALALVARAHRDMPAHLRGPALVFWVFHVLRDYAGTLRDGDSGYAPLLPDLLAQASRLEAAVGPVELVFGHNDLLPANFLHDGARMWLVDWDYAGFNSPLFDLGGLAANNGLTPAQEARMLSAYYDRAPDAALWRSYRAMKAASALREAMWSMVQEIHSELDFDYAAYTATNLDTYRAALAAFEES
ncbi:choline/ethanolamine kinase family protein [Paragemmobacter straminiformis]|uniref:Phosphotransferase family protein n=1 Tax=Paragemmobacter straminiformis TaxID=2045119 RepID=A0A842ICC3_9RHOB|nr:choline/ethanolamine kinase family protein [Gemmobacter straminiformis]MBC2837480.1 phosphotransferase family protein [Gemmobacter straminiformis]